MHSITITHEGHDWTLLFNSDFSGTVEVVQEKDSRLFSHTYIPGALLRALVDRRVGEALDRVTDYVDIPDHIRPDVESATRAKE